MQDNTTQITTEHFHNFRFGSMSFKTLYFKISNCTYSCGAFSHSATTTSLIDCWNSSTTMQQLVLLCFPSTYHSADPHLMQSQCIRFHLIISEWYPHRRGGWFHCIEFPFVTIESVKRWFCPISRCCQVQNLWHLLCCPMFQSQSMCSYFHI